MPDEVKKQALADRIANYVVEHHKVLNQMHPHEKDVAEKAIKIAIRVMTDDIGAAQDFLNAIGVDYDLFKNRTTDEG